MAAPLGSQEATIQEIERLIERVEHEVLVLETESPPPKPQMQRIEVVLRESASALAALQARETEQRQQAIETKNAAAGAIKAWMDRAEVAESEQATLRQEIARLTAERDRWGPEFLRDLARHLGLADAASMDEIEERVASLRQQHTQLREALEQYGKHPESCPKGVGVGYYKPRADAVCNCGIDAAFASVPSVAPKGEHVNRREHLMTSPNVETLIAEIENAAIETQVFAQMQPSNGSLHAMATHWCELFSACQAVLRTQQEALKKFSTHRRGCASETWDHPAWGYTTGKPCDCGLDAALAGTATPPQETKG